MQINGLKVGHESPEFVWVRNDRGFESTGYHCGEGEVFESARWLIYRLLCLSFYAWAFRCLVDTILVGTLN